MIPIPLENDKDFTWTDVSKEPEYLIGDAARKIPPGEPYELFYPFEQGRLNVSKYSIQVVMTELELIWRYVLKEKLKVDVAELKVVVRAMSIYSYFRNILL
jgi:hypothetical protein